MFNSEFDYSNDSLIFNYINLKKYLFGIYKQGIDNINIILLVSLEKEYYEGENLKKIMKDLKDLSNNLVCEFDGKKQKFRVNKIRLIVGDVLNRHRWMYRYNEKYMIDNIITDEDEIPDYIKKEIEIKAYETSKQQGRDWFRKHGIGALNSIIPYGKQLDKSLKITNEFIEIFNGSNKIPKIECISTELWLKHPKYGEMKKVFDEVRNLPNSIVEKSFYNEAKYFLDRLENRNEIQKFPDIFIKYSKEYIAEESLGKAIVHRDSNNTLEFYYGSTEPMHTMVFRGRKAQNNEVIKKYMEKELSGLKLEHFVSIKNK